MKEKQHSTKKVISNTSSKRFIFIGIGIVLLVYFLFAIWMIPVGTGEPPKTTEDCTSITNLTDRSNCFYQLATETQNSNFCKEMDISVGRPLFPFVDCLKFTNGLHSDYCNQVPEAKTSSCNFAIAVGLEDVSLCSKSDDQPLCETITKSHSLKLFDKIMSEKGNKEIIFDECEQISLDKHYFYENDRDECIYFAALAENDLKICYSIQDEMRRVDCIIELVTTEDTCLTLSDENLWPRNSDQNHCFFQLAIKTHNSKFCVKIGDNGIDGITESCPAVVDNLT